MRRTDKEITAFADLVSVVDRCDVVRIAMTDGETPYLVPMSFGYTAEDGTLTLYLHSATEGRKLDLWRRNPAVCFEMDCAVQIVSGEAPCGWSANYESVVGSGHVVFLEDPTEKRHALDALMRHYGYQGTPVYPESVLSRTCCCKLVAEELSGKRSLRQNR